MPTTRPVKPEEVASLLRRAVKAERRLPRLKRLGKRTAWRQDVETCSHMQVDTNDHYSPHIGSCHDGVVCMECGMLLTWDELARYMRGDD